MTEQNTPKQGNNKLTIILVAVIVALMVSNYFEKKHLQEQQAIALEKAANPLTPSNEELISTESQKPVLETTKTVQLQNNTYTTTVDLKGGKITDVELKDFVKEKDKPELVKILNSDSENPMMFDAGWLANGMNTPNVNTNWNIENQDENSITLSWSNNQGVKFLRTYEFVDGKFLTNVTDKVINGSNNTIQLAHYAQLHHVGEREEALANSFTNYTGPEAIFNNERLRADYKDLKDGKDKTIEGKYGWAAITRQYFAAAIIPTQAETTKVRFKHTKVNNQDFYTALTKSELKTVEPNQNYERKYKIYVGPKSTKVLEEQGLDPKTNLAAMLDYGWFHIIAKPIFDAIMFANKHIGSLAVSIIIVTILLKIALFPFANKSYKSMAEMRKIQPEMKKLQERFANDRQTLGLEMMKLYKKHNVSPASGCWPMLIQIPIFFAMYKVILMSFEFRQAELGLWIHDMSMKDPFFVLPILMGISMIVQQKMNPQPLDETQKMVMNVLPIVFTALFLFFPAGLVLYWLTNNILSIGQQYIVMKKHNS